MIQTIRLIGELIEIRLSLKLDAVHCLLLSNRQIKDNPNVLQHKEQAKNLDSQINHTKNKLGFFLLLQACSPYVSPNIIRLNTRPLLW